MKLINGVETALLPPYNLKDESNRQEGLMKKTVLLISGIIFGLFLTGSAGLIQEQTSQSTLPISWDNWLAARSSAEKSDSEGKYSEALQYYLEYTRQAEGLSRPDLVAWGKNNAAYMIIKMHKQDPSVDLAPAKNLLEEGLAVPEATEECKKFLTRNLEYVGLYLR